MEANRAHVRNLRKDRRWMSQLLFVSAYFCLGISSPAIAQAVQRISAIVNDEIISKFDLDNRVRLVATTANLPSREDVYRRLRPQVLRGLIDERLQLQEAANLKIRVRQREINRTIEQLARRNRMSLEQMWQLLEQRKVDRSALEMQVKARLSWLKIIERKFARQVSVGEEELAEEMERLRQARGQPQLKVSEIFLGIDNPDEETSVRETAEKLIQQISGNASFAAMAREFSQSTTAGRGGDLGWITESALDEELVRAIVVMQPGQISPPIRTRTGYYILYLVERRVPKLSGTASEVRFRRMTFPLLPNAIQSEIDEAGRRAQNVSDKVRSCVEFVKMGRELRASNFEKMQSVSSDQLSGAFRELLLMQNIGVPSAPRRNRSGISIFIVCDRAVKEAGLPSVEELGKGIRQKRMNLLAQRYMRDLRRSAYVDLRQ